MGKLMTSQNALLAVLRAEARPENIAAEDWPLIFSNPDPKKKIEVVTRRTPDIQSAIEKAMLGASIGLVIFYQGADTPEPDIPGLQWECEWALTASENVMNNKTGYAAEDVVERAAAVVHFAGNGNEGGHALQNIFTCSRRSERPIPPPSKQPFINTRVLYVRTNLSIN